MECAKAREELLVLDPGELERLNAAGKPFDGLSEHLRECPDCRSDLRVIVSEQHGITAAFADVDRLAPNRVTKAARVKPTGRGLWVPLAAAATIAVLLFARANQPAHKDATDVSVAPVVVNVPVGRDVTIFKTTDPNITVVWYR